MSKQKQPLPAVEVTEVKTDAWALTVSAAIPYASRKSDALCRADLPFDLRPDGAVGFDNDVPAARLLLRRTVRRTLAATILTEARSRNPDALAGRTARGISTELLLHYLAYRWIPLFRDRTRVADMGGVEREKPGYDGNAWLYK